MARTICHDAELSELLGEVFDIVGEFGRLEIRKGEGRGLLREYVEGMYWEKGLFSREMIAEAPAVRVELENPAIVISDLRIAEAEQLLPVLSCALKNDLRKLMIVAGDISDAALAFLLANNRDRDRLQIIAVRAPGYGAEEQAWALTDLVALCGGRAFIQAAGDSLRSYPSGGFRHMRGAGGPDSRASESLAARASRARFGVTSPAFAMRTAGPPASSSARNSRSDWASCWAVQRRCASARPRRSNWIRAWNWPNEPRLWYAAHCAMGSCPVAGLPFSSASLSSSERARAAASMEERAAYTILATAMAAPAAHHCDQLRL